MPEVPGNPPSPRVALFWNGTAWQWALVDAAGHLQLDVVTSGLPAGAATAAAQALALAQLQLIEDIRDALQSVATDRLIVRGEDQLHSFQTNLVSRRVAVVSGAGGYVDSDICPAGEVWHVTNLNTIDETSPTTSHSSSVRRGGVNYSLTTEVAAFAALAPSIWRGDLWLIPDDRIRVYFGGSLVADQCTVTLHGEVMTLEV